MPTRRRNPSELPRYTLLLLLLLLLPAAVVVAVGEEWRVREGITIIRREDGGAGREAENPPKCGSRVPYTACKASTGPNDIGTGLASIRGYE